MTITPTSGQARINAKRRARQEFWTEERRTVLISVSAEAEPYFRDFLPNLGKGARIDSSTPLINWHAIDFAVHIPGAPPQAVRAEPTLKSIWHDDHYEPVLDSIQWTDAHGHAIGPRTGQDGQQ